MSDQLPELGRVKFTRKKVLQRAGLLAAAGLTTFLSRGTAPNYVDNFSDQRPAQTVAVEGSFKREKVSGIDLYGYPVGLNSIDEIESLNVFLDQEFTRGKTIHANPDNRHQVRLELMPQKQRNLQLFISDQTFAQFESIGGKEELMRRLNLHIQVMNKMLSDLYPSVDLRSSLKRVVVIKEGLLREFNFTEGLYPLDVDGRWDIKGRDFLIRSLSGDQGAYIEKAIVNGKEEEIDYGLIHEWFHSLFSYPDEYTQNFEGSPTIPALFIDKSPGIKNMSYWVGYFLNAISKRGIRGMYTDPRAFGGGGFMSNHPDDPQSTNGILGMHPENSSIQLTEGGKPITAFILVSKETSTWDYLTGKKYTDDPDSSMQQSNNPVKLPEAMFAPSKRIFRMNQPFFEKVHFLYPQGWFMTPVTPNKNLPSIHIPAMAINMAALAGQKDANFVVNLVKNYTAGINPSWKKQVIRVYGPKEKSVQAGFFAEMAVPGTPIVIRWYGE